MYMDPQSGACESCADGEVLMWPARENEIGNLDIAGEFPTHCEDCNLRGSVPGMSADGVPNSQFSDSVLQGGDATYFKMSETKCGRCGYDPDPGDVCPTNYLDPLLFGVLPAVCVCCTCIACVVKIRRQIKAKKL